MESRESNRYVQRRITCESYSPFEAKYSSLEEYVEDLEKIITQLRQKWLDFQ